MELAQELLDKEIPGPRGLELMKLGMMFQRDPLKTYDHIHHTYGDLVWCPWPNRATLFLFHPDDIRRVLKDNQNNYHKSDEYSHMKPLLGEGLLTAEDEKWKTQRKIMAREFHSARIEEYLPMIKDKIHATLMSLKAGETFDVGAIFSKLTFQIAGEIFFGADVSQFSDEAKTALENETERINKRMRRAFNLPFVVPSPENCRGRKSVATLDQIVTAIMNEKGDHQAQNVLSKLMQQSPALDKKTIRDEVMTLLLAGHETTSNTLTWTFAYLCGHQEWQKKLHEELAAIGKRPEELSMLDIPQLKIHRSVIQEAIRLRPPIPAIARKSIREDVFSGYHINAEVAVTLLPYVTHRDPRFWTEPLSFRPERFIERKDRKDDFTYFPFARGARACIGEELAMVESILILAHFMEKRIWKMEDGFQPRPVHNLTLQSENGLRTQFILDSGYE